MPVPTNGTHAKEIALHYLNATDQRATPSIMVKTVSQAKSILSAGYTKEEIIRVIDAIVEKGVVMYSIGYVSACINDVLREIKVKEDAEKAKAQAKIEAERMATTALEKRNEVTTDVESTERNRSKAGRFGVQSRFGKKHNFDMFEKHGEDS